MSIACIEVSCEYFLVLQVLKSSDDKKLLFIKCVLLPSRMLIGLQGERQLKTIEALLLPYSQNDLENF